MYRELQKGEIVSVIVESLNETDDGFVLEVNDSEGLDTYEKIDLTTYPSFDDYRGDITKVRTGDIGTVFSFVGRPLRIVGDAMCSNYDVYEILIHGKMKQIFRRNLLTLEELKEIKC